MKAVQVLVSALALPVLLAVSAGRTQAGIRYIQDRQLFVIETNRTSYVMGVNEIGELQHLYWGPRLDRDADLAAARLPRGLAFESPAGLAPLEYPGWGGMRYDEPCLKVTFADGTRDLVLKYVDHQGGDSNLVVTLKDIQEDVRVSLEYRVHPRHDVVVRSVSIDNLTGRPVVIESAQSAAWAFPRRPAYRLSHLHGRWGAETRLARETVGPGKKVLESRRGNTSHQANPWFALDPGDATETAGEVYFGALAWSGNWKIVVERTSDDRVRVVGGLNDFDFAHRLEPGESLVTPEFYGGYTGEGFGEASRVLHRLVRERILPDRADPRPRPVLYNSWYATTFDVDEAGQKALAEKAAGLGVELFVIDDGWFGARNDDRAGLGDWTVNREKFPRGLGPLIDHVHSLGMEFGLWVEPEMVNPDSDLYRAHPDWVIHFPGRPRTEGRNQLVLNLARDDVREHLFGVLDRLLSENDIDFLKWDMNRHLSEPGWPERPGVEQKELWLRYVLNVYDLLARLRGRHPDLEIEACSGGGGRVDLGILHLADQVWTSDNTEAFDRLSIQEGFTFAYPPKVMVDWVIDVPDFNGRSTPLEYRFLVAMTGALGIGADLTKWSKEDLAFARGMISFYKQVRETIQHGDLYRLVSPREGDFAASQYVSADGDLSVLFAFRHSQQFGDPVPTVRLRGLDPAGVYLVRSLDESLPGAPLTLGGATLMHRGLDLRLVGDYDAAAVLLERRE